MPVTPPSLPDQTPVAQADEPARPESEDAGDQQPAVEEPEDDAGEQPQEPEPAKKSASAAEPIVEKTPAPPPPTKPADEAPKPEPKSKPTEKKPEPTETRPEAAEKPAKEATKSGAPQLIATVQVASHVPDASEVPYTECVTFVKYRVESVAGGSYEGDEVLAVFWGMRDSKRQPAADFKPGQRHKLTIQPFSARADLARVMQADDTDEYALQPYWVTGYSSP